MKKINEAKKEDASKPKQLPAVDDWSHPESHENLNAMWPLIGFALVLAAILVYAVLSN